MNSSKSQESALRKESDVVDLSIDESAEEALLGGFHSTEQDGKKMDEQWAAINAAILDENLTVDQMLQKDFTFPEPSSALKNAASGVNMLVDIDDLFGEDEQDADEPTPGDPSAAKSSSGGVTQQPDQVVQQACLLSSAMDPRPSKDAGGVKPMSKGSENYDEAAHETLGKNFIESASASCDSPMISNAIFVPVVTSTPVLPVQEMDEEEEEMMVIDDDEFVSVGKAQESLVNGASQEQQQQQSEEVDKSDRLQSISSVVANGGEQEETVMETDSAGAAAEKSRSGVFQFNPPSPPPPPTYARRTLFDRLQFSPTAIGTQEKKKKGDVKYPSPMLKTKPKEGEKQVEVIELDMESDISDNEGTFSAVQDGSNSAHSRPNGTNSLAKELCQDSSRAATASNSTAQGPIPLSQIQVGRFLQQPEAAFVPSNPFSYYSTSGQQQRSGWPNANRTSFLPNIPPPPANPTASVSNGTQPATTIFSAAPGGGGMGFYGKTQGRSKSIINSSSSGTSNRAQGLQPWQMRDPHQKKVSAVPQPIQKKRWRSRSRSIVQEHRETVTRYVTRVDEEDLHPYSPPRGPDGSSRDLSPATVYYRNKTNAMAGRVSFGGARNNGNVRRGYEDARSAVYQRRDSMVEGRYTVTASSHSRADRAKSYVTDRDRRRPADNNSSSDFRRRQHPYSRCRQHSPSPVRVRRTGRGRNESRDRGRRAGRMGNSRSTSSSPSRFGSSSSSGSENEAVEIISRGGKSSRRSQEPYISKRRMGAALLKLVVKNMEEGSRRRSKRGRDGRKSGGEAGSQSSSHVNPRRVPNDSNSRSIHRPEASSAAATINSSKPGWRGSARRSPS